MNIKIKLFYPLKLISFLFLISCVTNNETKTPIKIAISKSCNSGHYSNYSLWLNKIDSTLDIVNLYKISMDSAIDQLQTCDGLILSGGPDVSPMWYGKEVDNNRLGDVDTRRDTLEFECIKTALKLNMPILGICRGLQIFNTSQGGTLFLDIPSDYDTLVKHRCKEKENCFHNITIDTLSMLYSITETNNGIVNSNHHQGIDRLAEYLKAVAWANDGLIEAIEWKDTTKRAFFIAVQWHPERMDTSSVLSLPLARQFLDAADKYQSENNK